MEKEVAEEYGYEPEEKEKSWLDMILEYIKSKEQSAKPKLEATT